MKDADDGGVAALKDADDAAHAAAVGFGRLHFDEHLVALHGAVDLVGRNKNIFATGRLAGVGTDEAVAVAMEVEAAGGEVVAGADGSGNAPVLAIELDEGAAGGQAGELLEEQAALHSAAQRELADQLLVAGFLAGGAGDPRKEFLVGHSSRVGHERRRGRGTEDAGDAERAGLNPLRREISGVQVF